MSNNLVEMNNNRVVTSSLVIARIFEKEHRTVIRSIETSTAQNCALLEHVMKSSYVALNGKTNPMYYLDRDAFSYIVMGFTGRRAAEWKWKYIQAFNEMEQKVQNTLTLPNFSNPAEAARAWAEQFEAREKAVKELTAVQPKAEYYDRLVDANHLTNLRDTAKESGIPQNEFIRLLISNNYLYRDMSGNLRPYSTRSEAFHLKEWERYGRTGCQTLVTVKGKELIRKLINRVYKKLGGYNGTKTLSARSCKSN